MLGNGHARGRGPPRLAHAAARPHIPRATPRVFSPSAGPAWAWVRRHLVTALGAHTIRAHGRGRRALGLVMSSPALTCRARGRGRGPPGASRGPDVRRPARRLLRSADARRCRPGGTRMRSFGARQCLLRRLRHPPRPRRSSARGGPRRRQRQGQPAGTRSLLLSGALGGLLGSATRPASPDANDFLVRAGVGRGLRHRRAPLPRPGTGTTRSARPVTPPAALQHGPRAVVDARRRPRGPLLGAGPGRRVPAAHCRPGPGRRPARVHRRRRRVARPRPQRRHRPDARCRHACRRRGVGLARDVCRWSRRGRMTTVPPCRLARLSSDASAVHSGPTRDPRESRPEAPPGPRRAPRERAHLHARWRMPRRPTSGWPASCRVARSRGPPRPRRGLRPGRAARPRDRLRARRVRHRLRPRPTPTDVVAAEVHVPGVARLIARADEAGLTNLRVHRGDAIALPPGRAPGRPARRRAPVLPGPLAEEAARQAALRPQHTLDLLAHGSSRRRAHRHRPRRLRGPCARPARQARRRRGRRGGAPGLATERRVRGQGPGAGRSVSEFRATLRWSQGRGGRGGRGGEGGGRTASRPGAQSCGEPCGSRARWPSSTGSAPSRQRASRVSAPSSSTSACPRSSRRHEVARSVRSRRRARLGRVLRAGLPRTHPEEATVRASGEPDRPRPRWWSASPSNSGWFIRRGCSMRGPVPRHRAARRVRTERTAWAELDLRPAS